MIVLDSSALLASLDGSEPDHARVVAALETEPGSLVLSPFVLAELDYFLLCNLGVGHELAFLSQVAAGAFELAPVEAEDVRRAGELIDRYRDLGIGLADASLVVLADRYGTDRILTLDERRFRALRTLDGRPFTLLPAVA